MKTIIIPTDFSPAATNAVHYAVDLATAINGNILLYHAYQVPISMGDPPVMLLSVDDLKKDADAKMALLKNQVKHIASGKLAITTETRLGDTTDELKDLCEQVNPFAVVMGSRGESGMDGAMFGKTTLSVARHLIWPVITIPPGRIFGTGINKIGLACDFRDVIKTTPVAIIKEFVKTFAAELHVLNVNKDHAANPEKSEESSLLHSLLEDLQPKYDFIEHNDVEEGINEFAEKNNFDLLIVIPRKHKLLEGIFKSSSTKQFIFQSHIPVMCIHHE